MHLYMKVDVLNKKPYHYENAKIVLYSCTLKFYQANLNTIIILEKSNKSLWRKLYRNWMFRKSNSWKPAHNRMDPPEDEMHQTG